MSENKLLREILDHYMVTGLLALRGAANSRIILESISRRMGSVRATDFASSKWRQYIALRLRSVKPSTLKGELTVLRSAWEAFGDGIPLWPKIRLPRVTEPEIRVLSDKQFERVLRHIGGAVTRDAVLFCRLTAARRSEVALSTWGQVNLERRTRNVSLSKHGQARVIPLNKQALMMLYNLRGEVGVVIGGLRQMGTKRRLKGKRRERLDRLCGYPIASGVIEGACRHSVKDRMERAGMRWTVDRAQAMLDLRSTYLNGDWDNFTTFRIKRETARLYPHRELFDGKEWPIAA